MNAQNDADYFNQLADTLEIVKGSIKHPLAERIDAAIANARSRAAKAQDIAANARTRCDLLISAVHLLERIVAAWIAKDGSLTTGLVIESERLASLMAVAAIPDHSIDGRIPPAAEAPASPRPVAAWVKPGDFASLLASPDPKAPASSYHLDSVALHQIHSLLWNGQGADCPSDPFPDGAEEARQATVTRVRDLLSSHLQLAEFVSKHVQQVEGE